MGEDTELRLDWVGLPVIATVARLLCHAGPIRDETPASDSRRGVAGVEGVRGRRSRMVRRIRHQPYSTPASRAVMDPRRRSRRQDTVSDREDSPRDRVSRVHNHADPVRLRRAVSSPPLEGLTRP